MSVMAGHHETGKLEVRSSWVDIGLYPGAPSNAPKLLTCRNRTPVERDLEVRSSWVDIGCYPGAPSNAPKLLTCSNRTLVETPDV